MHILTSGLGAQHSNAGQNIQHSNGKYCTPLLKSNKVQTPFFLTGEIAVNDFGPFYDLGASSNFPQIYTNFVMDKKQSKKVGTRRSRV